MVKNLIADAASMLLVLVFALLLGAQMFDTFVNQPVFFSDPPDSVSKYLKHPTTPGVPAYFARLIVLVIAATVIAIAVYFIMAGPTGLLVSAVCAILYLALVFLFFIPTNQKLGFLPPVAGTLPVEPRLIVRLSQQWRVWNCVRICIQFAGLIAAVLAVSHI